MRRGELSCQPQPVCGLDWRILIEPKYPDAWFAKYLPALPLQAGFEKTARALLPLRSGAKGWLERNWETRFCVVAVGVPDLIGVLGMVLEDRVAEIEHFENPGALRTWLRQNPQVYRVLTADLALIGLDGIALPFSGWAQTP